MTKRGGSNGNGRLTICGLLALVILASTEVVGWCALRGPRANVINDYVERGARPPDMTSEEYNQASSMRDQKKSSERVRDYIERGARSPDMTSKEYDAASKVREEKTRASRVQNYIATGGITPGMTNVEVEAGRKVREQTASAKRISDYIATGGISSQMTSTEYEQARQAREKAPKSTVIQDYLEGGVLPAGSIPSKEMYEERQAKIRAGTASGASKGGGTVIGPVGSSASTGGGGAIALLEQAQSRYAGVGSGGGQMFPVEIRSPTNTSGSGARGRSPSSGNRSLSTAQIKAIYAKNSD